jgi:hypothetical protein
MPSNSSKEGFTFNILTGGAAVIAMTLAVAPLALATLGQLGTSSVPAHVTRSRMYAGYSKVELTQSVIGSGLNSPVFDILIIADFWEKFHLTTTSGISSEPPAFSPVVPCK